MKSIAQAWNFLRTHKIQSITIGILGFLLFSLSFLFPMVVVLFPLSFLILTEAANSIHKNDRFSSLKDHLVANFVRVILVAIILIPAGVFVGSAIGLLQGPYEAYFKVSISMLLLTITSYFIFIFSQVLLVPRSSSLAKTIDLLFISSFKSKREIMGLCVTAALLMLTSEYSKGVGLLLATPLLIFANIFYFENFIAPLLRQESLKPASGAQQVADVQSP